MTAHDVRTQINICTCIIKIHTKLDPIYETIRMSDGVFEGK